MKRFAPYRGPAEPMPRATASGDQNVISLGAIPEGVILSQPPLGVREPCPAWGCGGPPLRVFEGGPGVVVIDPIARPVYPVYPAYPGATSTVPQPPPSAGTTLTVPNPATPPVSPAPSPTVGVDPSQTAPSLSTPGQTLAQQTGTPWDLGTWLGESTVISGLPNWGLAVGGLIAAWALFGGNRGRR